MKTLFRLLPLGVLCLCAVTTPAAAQMGSNPFARIYAAPQRGQAPAATPNPALAAAQNPYAAAGLNPAAVPPSYEAADPNHKLGTGDTLSFLVVEDREPAPQSVVVNASGDAQIPYIGLVPATGKTVAQFTSEVKARLEREYFYHANVMMGLTQTAIRQSRGRVYVTGEVHIVGAVDIPADEALTVSKAVIKAGGMMDFGDQRAVKVIDKDGKERARKVDVKAIMSGKSKGDMALEPGDTVIVPRRSIIF